MRHVLACFIALLLVAACSPVAQTGGSGTTPTIEEAEGFLSQLVGLAQAGNFDGLCALGDLNCKRSLDAAGRENVPLNPPTVVGARVIPTTTSGDQTSIGGMVLELCGTTRSGQGYASEILVFRDRAGLRAINPVYWGTIKIGAGPGTPASPAPNGKC